MTPEEKNQLYTCSIQGFLKEFRESNYQNAQDALMGSLAYVVKWNLDPEKTECDLHELIYVIRNEVAKMVAKDQVNADEKNLTNLRQGDDNEMLQQFFTDPMQFTENLIKAGALSGLNLDNDPEPDPDLEEFYDKVNKNDDNILREFETAKEDYKNFVQNKNISYEPLYNLKSKLPNNSIDESLDKQKPGFFEWIFRRTSKEYTDFQKVFQNYKYKNSEQYGRHDLLEAAALKYIRHKFPNLEEGKLPTQEQIATLGGAGKERAAFCIKVVEMCRENAIQKNADAMLKAVGNLGIKVPKYDEIMNNDQQPVNENNLDNSNIEFQNNLENDANEQNNQIEEIIEDNSEDLEKSEEYDVHDIFNEK